MLAIESSCDETAAAIVERETSGALRVRSNIVASQHELHRRYAGVVPEIASRAHLEKILPVVHEALAVAEVSLADLDAVSVGIRPGLIGSLLVGVSAAKAIAWSLSKPFYGIDHVEAHLWSGLLEQDLPAFPALGLVVSGGHTSLFLLESSATPKLLGWTIDDALGEAFDKAAFMLGLPHPGGPHLEQLASHGNAQAHAFPLADGGALQFSFSGLKTAMLYAVRGVPAGRGKTSHFTRSHEDLSESAKADLAASFQSAAIRAVLRRLRQAYELHPCPTLLVGGGVVANNALRHDLMAFALERNIALRMPPQSYCVDNAAMIGGAAWMRIARGDAPDLLTIPAQPMSKLASA